MIKISSDDSQGNVFASRALSSQPVAIFVYQQNGRDRRFETEGQHTRTLLSLIQAGDQGVTRAEVQGFVAGLATWCGDLRRLQGLDIAESRDPDGATRYTLITPVRIVFIEFPPHWPSN